MKVSQKTEYGLRAMVALALQAGVDKPVPLPVIAQTEQIPEQFLDQIVSKLRKAGFVKSVRGVNGGYMLSRPPEDITIGSLVRLLEGSLSPMACVSDELMGMESSCGLQGQCKTRGVWLRVTQAITKALDGLTLQDVMQDTAVLSVL